MAVNKNVERLRVAEIRRRRPRRVLLFALRPVDLRRRLRNHPHGELDARVEARQRVGRFRPVGLDLNVARRTDVELEAEGAADLIDPVQAGYVPAENCPDGVLRQAAFDRGAMLGLSSFREAPPDSLREIDGRHVRKYTASRSRRRLTTLASAVVHFGTYTYAPTACIAIAAAGTISMPPQRLAGKRAMTESRCWCWLSSWRSSRLPVS